MSSKTLSSYEHVLYAFILMNIESKQRAVDIPERFVESRFIKGNTFLANGLQGKEKSLPFTFATETSQLYKEFTEELVKQIKIKYEYMNIQTFEELLDQCLQDIPQLAIADEVASSQIRLPMEVENITMEDAYVQNHIQKTVKNVFTLSAKAKSCPYINDIAQLILDFIKSISKPLALNVLYSTSTTTVKVTPQQLMQAISVNLDNNVPMLVWLSTTAHRMETKPLPKPSKKKTASSEVQEDNDEQTQTPKKRITKKTTSAKSGARKITPRSSEITEVEEEESEEEPPRRAPSAKSRKQLTSQRVEQEDSDEEELDGTQDEQ